MARHNRRVKKIKKKTGKKGFEPLTPWFVATCSSPLSYKPFNYAFFYKSCSGVVGLEPTNSGVKVRCLTTWLHPMISGNNSLYTKIELIFTIVKLGLVFKIKRTKFCKAEWY